MSLTPDTTTDEVAFDLDRRRAAAREMRKPPTFTIDGKRHELPLELPVDVFEPLLDVNVDVSLLIRQALEARAGGEGAGEEILGMVLDMLVVNPKLPRELIEAVKEMVRRLAGEEGYNALASARLTAPEIKELALWAMGKYGVGLGEASPSSDSSEGTGTTSKQTSRRATRGSTSGRSTSRRTTRGS